MHEPPLLQIQDLAVSFARRDGGRHRAVDGVRLTVYPRQTLAVVGESGSGKSVTAMSVLRLLAAPPAVYEHGRIMLDTGSGPRDLLKVAEREIRSVRGGDIAMIFQEPMTSLNPVYPIGDQIVEAIRQHRDVDRRQASELPIDALREVGMASPGDRLGAYPHEFSGGMRQRVMIAMALACRPKLLLADEPTTALDVTIQAQVLELLAELRRTSGMAVMLITHALGVVAQNADVVCVMYAGRVVEYASVQELFDNPMHPYSRALLACTPLMHGSVARLRTIREVVEDEGEFTRLAPLRPWWPEHAPPAGVRRRDGQSPAADYDLHEAKPGHWVGVWRTDAAAANPGRMPELNWRDAVIAASPSATSG